MRAHGDGLAGAAGGPAHRASTELSRRAAGGLALAAVGAAVAGAAGYGQAHQWLPLLSRALLVDPWGHLRSVREGEQVETIPGTRVEFPTDPALRPAAQRLAQAQRSWLAEGTLPGEGTAHGPMVRLALLDLHLLVADNGACVAGWPPYWRYVWPRDAAFVAVALACTGHADQALDVLGFLQRVQPADGLFQARYRPDASGPPDARGAQLDGVGWALWATDQVLSRVPSGRERALATTRLSDLVRRSSEAALRSIASRDGLPGASPDYWEVPERQVTLGTAAPLLAGLRAAVTLQGRLGDDRAAALARHGADRLDAAVRTAFAPTYGRYPRSSPRHRDAATAFLLPPFTSTVDPQVLAAWKDSRRRMRRPNGGLAPGAGWPHDGIAWTPQTALYALTAAWTGGTAEATGTLEWLSAHRTDLGALPEKVLHNGEPASVAPLAWTAACVVLAAAALATPSGSAPST